MTRDFTQQGYLIRNLGTSVQIHRPGEKDPSLFTGTVPEALDLVELDRRQSVIGGALIGCPGCIAAQCGCLPA